MASIQIVYRIHEIRGFDLSERQEIVRKAMAAPYSIAELAVIVFVAFTTCLASWLCYRWYPEIRWTVWLLMPMFYAGSWVLHIVFCRRRVRRLVLTWTPASLDEQTRRTR